MSKKHDPELIVPASFRFTAAMLRHYEKQRIGTQNRLYALTEFPAKKDWGMGLPPDHPNVVHFTQLLQQVKAAEDEIIDELVWRYKETPLHAWSSQYKGLGAGKLMARLIGELGDPYLQLSGFTKDGKPVTEPRARTLGQLRGLTGMSNTTGVLPRHSSGQQSGFNGKIRSRLWLCGTQVVKNHDPYFLPYYQAAKEKYLQEQYRGTKANGSPWEDRQHSAVAWKRALISSSAELLRLLYQEARRIHNEALDYRLQRGGIFDVQRRPGALIAERKPPR